MQGYIEAKQAVNLENPVLSYNGISYASGGLSLSDYFTTAYLQIGNSTLSASASSTAFGSGGKDGSLKFD